MFKKAKLNDILEERLQAVKESLNLDLSDDANLAFEEESSAFSAAFDAAVAATMQENAAAEAFDLGVAQAQSASVDTPKQTV
jgi:hypothetical protein